MSAGVITLNGSGLIREIADQYFQPNDGSNLLLLLENINDEAVFQIVVSEEFVESTFVQEYFELSLIEDTAAAAEAILFEAFDTNIVSVETTPGEFFEFSLISGSAVTLLNFERGIARGTHRGLRGVG